MKYDIVVIGAGVVGSLITRELSKYNIKVALLERCNDCAMGATKANSAIVHAGFDAKEGSKKAYFNVKGSEMMEKVDIEKYRSQQSADAIKTRISDIFKCLLMKNPVLGKPSSRFLSRKPFINALSFESL